MLGQPTANFNCPFDGVDADDHFTWSADFSLTSACPMNGLAITGSALPPPKADQVVVGATRVGPEIDEVARELICTLL